MGKIIACIDGSAHADSVCSLSAWAAKRTGMPISLLHVVAPHSDVAAKSDLSGQIGLGARSGLLKELTEMDEARGKLELKKGQMMLEHARTELARKGIMQVETLHRRGSLVDTLTGMEAEAELVVMGRRGEHADAAPQHLGSNLERVARAIHKPLLVATREAGPIARFLIAYDGSASADKAVEYAVTQPLLKGLECHLLKVGDAHPDAQATLDRAAQRLRDAGFTVHAALQQGKPEKLVAQYIAAHAIDLLVIGAYGHSKIRSLILGSTTTALIRNSTVPVFLFR